MYDEQTFCLILHLTFRLPPLSPVLSDLWRKCPNLSAAMDLGEGSRQLNPTNFWQESLGFWWWESVSLKCLIIAWVLQQDQQVEMLICWFRAKIRTKAAKGVSINPEIKGNLDQKAISVFVDPQSALVKYILILF